MLSCEKVEKFKLSRMEDKTSNREKEVFLKNQKRNDENLDEETRCGVGIFKGEWMQKLASKKTFLLVNALIGMVHSSNFHYYSGTLTTLEKHYKLSSAQTGYIGSVYDIVATVVSLIVPYYCSKGHFPRWMGFSIFTFGVSCSIYALPYFLYGAGDDALSLTEEYGSTFNPNTTQELIYQEKMKELCYENKTIDDCSEVESDNTSLSAALLLILSSAISGCAGAIYYVLAPVYIDDNVKKSKAPIMLCISHFVRLLSSAIGFSLASYCLKFYINPSLHPKITDEDPRWIGAWWIGHVVFAIAMFILAPMIYCFPKTLPRAAMRKKQKMLRKMANTSEKNATETSLKDLLQTFKRLLTNKPYFCNLMAAVFYCFGYIPFFFFQAKYIQIHFLFSPSTANLITGTVSLVFTAIGLLTAGVVITVFKPRARYLAMWNVIASIVSVFGVVGYGYFSCSASGNSLIMENSKNFSTCNQNCNCDFVQYNPICGENNVTYISSCHAGCTDEIVFENGTKIFTNCRCVNSTTFDEDLLGGSYGGGSATTGACPVDCMPKFLLFFFFLCLNKFIGGTEGTANFLLGIRCVEKKDKAISMGLTTAVVSLFAVVPSPIFFGWIIDRCCIFWGKTCSKQGNCWLYDTEGMRYTLNFTAAGFVLIGTLWDVGTWYYSKDVNIFDESDDESEEEKELQPIIKNQLKSID